MVSVKIRLNNEKREHLFNIHVDDQSPPSVVKDPNGEHEQVTLDWDGAINDEGHLRHCPVCECKDLFVRNDFPQVTGLVVVALAAVISLIMLYHHFVLYACVVLGLVVLIDFLIYFFTGKVLVCYHCRSEFRDLPIRDDHAKWELSIGERYRR